MQGGNWDGTQVVDSWYVDQTLVPMANQDEGWQIHLNFGGKWGDIVPRDAYAAQGASGSVIFACPSEDLIFSVKTVPHFGDDYNIQNLLEPIMNAISECADGETRQCGNDIGACEFGEQTCADGTWGDCLGGTGPQTEQCNGIDDNCDGSTDEGCNCIDGEIQPCGTNTGVCEFGQETCTEGEWGPCTGGIGPQAEICNGLDDDCDGEVPADEADADTDGFGVCDGDCDDLDDSVGPQAEETCNGRDDNCDGSTDEDCACRDGDTLSCGLAEGVCEPGVQHCESGAWGDCRGSVDPSSEVCGDELDNDCDGLTDEDCTGDDQEPVIEGGCGCGAPRSPAATLLMFLVAFAVLRPQRYSSRRRGGISNSNRITSSK
jgi:hypothetical protein